MMRRLAAALAASAAIVACAADDGGEAATEDEDLSSFHGARVAGYDETLPDVDAIGYDIDLTAVNATRGREAYAAKVKGTYVATRALESLALDFDGNEITSVKVGARRATSRREGARLVVDLPAKVAKGQSFTVTVEYRGAFFQADGKDRNDFGGFGGLMVAHTSRAQKTVFASLSWPQKARRWLPLRDHPADGAMVTMKATFPAGLEVVSNGRRESVVDNGDGTRTSRYQALTPMPPYDIFLAAFDGWKVHESRAGDVTVSAYTYDRDADGSPGIYGDVPAALDYYTKTFGPFVWGKDMRYLEMPMYGGGMENATCVGMDETLFPKSAREEARLVAFHELAHHWSGNSVRFSSWNDFWLSEGFTEYLTRRFVESHDGAEASRALWRKTLASALSAEAASLHPVRPADPERDVLGFFDDVVYEKGAFVLRMLEERVGRERFTAFLARWFTAHRFGHVTTADFEREASAAAGEDLSGFFAQWIFGEGHPEVRATTKRVDAQTIEVTVDEVQAKGAFDLEVEVELGAGAETRRVKVPVRGKRGAARVAMAADPARVVVDPDEKAYLTVTCDTGARCRDGYRCAGAVCRPN